MGVNDWSQAERDLYALGSRLLLDDMERTRQSMAAELDLYRDDWSTRHAEMTRAHQERVRQIEAAQAAWLADFINGETGEVTPTQDPQGQAVGASAAGSTSPAMPGGGPSPGHPLTADDIAAMSMQEYTALRANLGLGNASGHRGLFG